VAALLRAPRSCENLANAMYISKFQVLKYKSYHDSTEIEFKPGFNIITGQNSAGKTALLEALTFRILPSPHRSIRTVPVPGGLPEATSIVRGTLVVSGDELLHFMQSTRGYQWFPAPDVGATQESMNRQLESGTTQRLPKRCKQK
jgi:predicted ATPase